jgi:hypothetical protein
MRIVPCLLIAGGAVASIATSAPPPAWTLSQKQLLTASVIDNETPLVRYHVHADLHVPEPQTGLDGILEVNVSITARTPSAGSATLEIDSLTHPDVMPAKMDVGLNNSFTNYISMDMWLDCTADPCSEDYELVVQRDPTADLPPIDISGDVTSLAWASKGSIPADAVLDLTVTPE